MNDEKKNCFVTGGSGFVGRSLIPMLLNRGYEVKALARSSPSASVVKHLGATVVNGNMKTADTLVDDLSGVEVVFHVGSTTENYGDYNEQYDINVNGTIRLIKAARGAGVRRLVYVSTAAIILGRKPISYADETFAGFSEPKGIYRKTKAIAERYVLNSNSPELETVVVRPPVVWGKGDTTILEPFCEAVKQNKLTWIAKGDYLISVVHVQNLCHGIILAQQTGNAGEIYNITDKEPAHFRTFFSKILDTQGLKAPNTNISRRKALAFGYIVPAIWKLMRKEGRPPFDAEVVYMLGTQFTLSDKKARDELGYQDILSFEDGFDEMRI